MSAASTGRRGPAPAAPDQGTSRPPDAEAPAGTRSRWAAVARWLPVVIVAAVMAALGVWGLARQGAMGNDEVASRWAAMLSLGQLFHLLSHLDAVHGLYYLLLHCWIAVGSTPEIIRIPSVIFMTAAAGLLVILARRLTGSAWAGLFAGLIMALDPVISYYAQTARSYAMVFCCVVAATLALVRALEAEDDSESGEGLERRLRSRWITYAALITLGGYLNELSLLVLAAHAVTVLLTRYGWRTVKHWFVSGAAGAILVLPVVALSIREGAADSGATRADLHDMEILFHDYFGATILVAVGMLVLAVFAVLPAPALPAIRIWRPDPAAAAEAASAWWKRGGFCLPSVAVPLLVLPSFLLVAESVVGKGAVLRPVHPVLRGRRRPAGRSGGVPARAMGGAVARAPAGRAARAGRRRRLAVAGVAARRARVRVRAGPAVRGAAAGPHPGEPPVRLRRPCLLHRRPRPGGRRRAVLQHVLPEDQARLPAGLPGHHRLRDGDIASPVGHVQRHTTSRFRRCAR